MSVLFIKSFHIYKDINLFFLMIYINFHLILCSKVRLDKQNINLSFLCKNEKGIFYLHN